jgi:hypothetical protein
MGSSGVDLQAMAYLTQYCNCKANKKEYNTISISITIYDIEKGRLQKGKNKFDPVSKHHVTKRYGGVKLMLHAF